MRSLLSMTWRDLLFAHWRVSPETVQRRLPDGISVDTYNGNAYLGVVPFVMADIRPRGVPVGLRFGELNLRTYVSVDGRPGVYFFNLDADDRVGVTLARSLFQLPYYRAEMDIETDGEGDTREVRFRSRRRSSRAASAVFDATYTPTGILRGQNRTLWMRFSPSDTGSIRPTRAVGSTTVISTTNRGRWHQRPPRYERTRCFRQTASTDPPETHDCALLPLSR